MYQLDRLCFDAPFRFSRAAMRHFASEQGAFTLVAEFQQNSGAPSIAAPHRDGWDATSPPAGTPSTQAPTLAGFIIIHLEHIHPRTQAYVVTLDVAPEHRRQGLARRLLEAAEQQSATRQASPMTLHVWTENTPAINFYERSGYVRTVLHPNMYAPGKDAYGYLKALTNPKP